MSDEINLSNKKLTTCMLVEEIKKKQDKKISGFLKLKKDSLVIESMSSGYNLAIQDVLKLIDGILP